MAAPTGEKAAAVADYVRDYQLAVIPLMTSVIAQVSVAADADSGEDSCMAELAICSSAGTEAVCCELSTQAVATIMEENSVINLGAPLLSCVLSRMQIQHM